MSVLASRIKLARELNSMTQETLGDAVGVTGLTVYRWETDKAYPRIQQLEKASEVLNKPLYWFFLPNDIEHTIIDESDLIALCDLYKSLNVTGRAKLLNTAIDLNDLARYH